MNKMIIGFTIMTAVVAGASYMIGKKKDIYDEDMIYDEDEHF